MTASENQPNNEHNAMALISLVIGVLEIIVALIPPFLFLSMACGPLGILGAVLGWLALRQIKQGSGQPRDRWLAIIGIFLGLLPMVILLGIFIYTSINGQMDPLTLP
jgi:uncharacterized membrane protein